MSHDGTNQLASQTPAPPRYQMLHHEMECASCHQHAEAIWQPKQQDNAESDPAEWVVPYGWMEIVKNAANGYGPLLLRSAVCSPSCLIEFGAQLIQQEREAAEQRRGLDDIPF